MFILCFKDLVLVLILQIIGLLYFIKKIVLEATKNHLEKKHAKVITDCLEGDSKDIIMMELGQNFAIYYGLLG